jgi:hypothetical protein
MQGKCMKSHERDDEIRAEYRREDLDIMERGKYAVQYAKASNVVVIDDALTAAFPNAAAVNAALRGLLDGTG